MAIEHFGKSMSRRRVYGLVERFKGGIVYTPSGRPLNVTLIVFEVDEQLISIRGSQTIRTNEAGRGQKVSCDNTRPWQTNRMAITFTKRDHLSNKNDIK